MPPRTMYSTWPMVPYGAARRPRVPSAMGLFAAYHPGDHVLVGRTEGSVMRNVVRPEPLGLMSAVRAAGYPCKMSGVDGRHVSIAGGRSRIWIIGVSAIDAVDRIAGSTFISGMVDELTRLQSGEEFFQMLWTRFSTDVRKLWATTNPGPLRHWVKRLVIDQPEKYRARRVQYRMSDNPSVSAETREALTAGLFGHHRLRMIDGLWVDATGLIYPSITQAAMPQVVSKFSIGFDWAGSGIVASVLAAHSPSRRGRPGRTHIAAERVYDHRERGALTDSEQAKRVAAWAREHTGMGGYGIPVYGDPTTPTGFQHALAAHGFVWQDGLNEVLPGIQKVSSGFGEGHLTVDPKCTTVLREAAEYSWDQKAMDEGRDEPQKGPDHCLDSIRYLWVTPSPLVSQQPFGPT